MQQYAAFVLYIVPYLWYTNIVRKGGENVDKVTKIFQLIYYVFSACYAVYKWNHREDE